MGRPVKLNTFLLIPALFHVLSALFSFSHGQNVGNLPVPVDGNMPMNGKDGNLPIPVPGMDGKLPMPGKDGNLPVPVPGKDGHMPVLDIEGKLPGPWKDGNLQVPFRGDFPGIEGSIKEKLAGARSGNGNGTRIVLAEKQTRRRDPLDHLNYYKGGWNITNRHYHASVAFSSFPFLVTASVWFVMFGLLMLCACCCCKKYINSYCHLPLAYVLCLVFLILFTISAISGCGVMFWGEKRFLRAVREAAGYVVRQGETISNGLIIVVNYLQSARNVSLNNKFLPPDIINQIDEVTSKLDESKDLPHLTTIRMANSLSEILEHVNTALISNTCTILLVALLGFLFSALGWQTWVYIFVIIGWIIMTLALILCGAFLAFHNLMADTCTAVDEWVQNPMAGSAIKELLPCVDREFGKNIKDASKSVSNGINDLLNLDISVVANNNDIPPQVVGLYYNQSGPSLPTVCDPYKAENDKQACDEGQVAVGNATQEWSKFVCHVSSSGICSTQGRLTPDLYKQMSSAANISYVLSCYVPFLASLVDCSTIWEILNYMHQHYCPGLRKHSQQVYIGLLVATISVMFCLISWVFYGKERQDRKHTKRNDKIQAETIKGINTVQAETTNETPDAKE
ncbi:Detected protein of unknown function [Hibiscus syriacus]|uniref:Transmembrane protein n=1 Tax=Hibiscus syriacus TaxID=106335 RepID=A0A6A3AKE1_HIBSY|nr:Detected protein of unknown function [Hibiscus syriacus]